MREQTGRHGHWRGLDAEARLPARRARTRSRHCGDHENGFHEESCTQPARRPAVSARITNWDTTAPGAMHSGRDLCDVIAKIVRSEHLSALKKGEAILRLAGQADNCLLDNAASARIVSALGLLAREDANVIELFNSDLRTRTKIIHRIEAMCKGLKLNPLTLTGVACGLANLGFNDETTLRHLSRQSRHILRHSAPEQISLIAWSFASFGTQDHALFSEVAAVAGRRINEFKEGKDLSVLAWAMAAGGTGDHGLFTLLAPVAAGRAFCFGNQSLSNTAWAFYTLGHRNDQLFKALARWGTPKLADFREKERTNFLLAFSSLGICDLPLFRKASEVIQEALRHSTMHIRGLSLTARSFAVLSIRDETLFDTIAEAAIDILKNPQSEVTAQDLTNLALAYASVNMPKPEMFALILNRALQMKDQLVEADYALLSWGLAIHYPADCRRFLQATRDGWANLPFSEGYARAMHQALVAAGLRLPEDYPPEVSTMIVAEQRASRGPNSFERLVSDSLKSLRSELGFSRLRFNKVIAGSLTDFTLRLPGGEKLDIECDGHYFHMLETEAGFIPTGSDVLQDRLCSLAGWRVVHVPQLAWEQLPDHQARTAWLKKEILRALRP